MLKSTESLILHLLLFEEIFLLFLVLVDVAFQFFLSNQSLVK